MTPMVAGIMIVAIASKTGLYFYCRKIGEEANSENVKALAQDHVNDVFSNTGAVLAAWAAYESPRLWWVGLVIRMIRLMFRPPKHKL
mmetsp:Transcript_25019/g.24775  ORF Transcript_25019/g.24775 Transcript_25019/m.24775 type:complete len:87 (-) Transcript_25019:311-571(-)